MGQIIYLKTLIPSSILAFCFYVFLWDFSSLFITRSELFKLSLKKYQSLDDCLGAESTKGLKSVSIFKHVTYYFYQFLLWISRRPTRIIFLSWRHRLLFLCWLGFLLPTTVMSIFFRGFWIFYWLVRLILNFCYKGTPLQVNGSYNFLIPRCFSSATYSRQNPEDIVYTITARSGLSVHFIEIFLWLTLKVPYYRSFDLIYKFVNFRSGPFGLQNSFFYKVAFILKLVLFKLVFHIPLYVVNLALECAVSFPNPCLSDSEYRSRYELLQYYLFDRILFKLFIFKELGPVIDKKLDLSPHSIKL